MQPLFVEQPALLAVWLVCLLIWRVMESTVDILSLKRLRAGAARRDRGSYFLILGLSVVGILVGLLVAFKVPATAITSARPVLFWLGIGILCAGIALRLYAIITLGAFFTTAVAVASEQTVIESGPYRLIRHPAYSGFLLILLGLGLSLTNWLSLLLILGCPLPGIMYRIAVEERALQAQLGQPYQEYMRHTKRLIPFVL
jgi:protein-S-isoprenylcysteine O-methyltransferase Ste14